MLAAAENALLARMRSHRDVARLTRAVDTLPKLPSDELLRRYYTDAPALYLVPPTFTVKNGLAYMRCTVAGVVRNVAGQDKARKGDGIDIGCDHLAMLIIRALNDQAVGQCTWLVTGGEMVDDDIFDAAGIAAIELTLESTGLELPYDYGEAELASLPGNSPIGNFKLFHADIDSPADAGALEYASWFQEPPDYTHSQPDLQMDVQLPGAST